MAFSSKFVKTCSRRTGSNAARGTSSGTLVSIRRADDLVDCLWHAFDGDLSSLEPRQLEQVRDETVEPFGLGSDHLREFLAFAFVESSLAERSARSHEGGQGSLEIVRQSAEQCVSKTLDFRLASGPIRLSA
jgi:hypothetical protein